MIWDMPENRKLNDLLNLSEEYLRKEVGDKSVDAFLAYYAGHRWQFFGVQRQFDPYGWAWRIYQTKLSERA